MSFFSLRDAEETSGYVSTSCISNYHLFCFDFCSDEANIFIKLLLCSYFFIPNKRFLFVARVMFDKCIVLLSFREWHVIYWLSSLNCFHPSNSAVSYYLLLTFTWANTPTMCTFLLLYLTFPCVQFDFFCTTPNQCWTHHRVFCVEFIQSASGILWSEWLHVVPFHMPGFSLFL